MAHEFRVLGSADAQALHALEQQVTGDAWSAARFAELLDQSRFVGLGAFCGSSRSRPSVWITGIWSTGGRGM